MMSSSPSLELIIAGIQDTKNNQLSTFEYFGYVPFILMLGCTSDAPVRDPRYYLIMFLTSSANKAEVHFSKADFCFPAYFQESEVQNNYLKWSKVVSAKHPRYTE